MRTVLFGLGLALVGCGGITPMSGVYDVTMTSAADTCGFDEGVGDSQEFESNIVFNDDGSVVFDGDDSASCSAKRATVTCDFSISSPGPDGYDYTINQDITFELVWDTNTSFTGWQVVSSACEGSDCSLLEDAFSFPCSSDYDFVGSMAEDAAE